MPTRSKSSRLPVLKTYKLFIGGAFPRSESGRYLPFTDSGKDIANYCRASRKDLRDAVVAARKASSTWAKATPYLRGQILYRMAEMLETRFEALTQELTRHGGLSLAQAKSDLGASIDLLVHYAGWTDKFAQVFGSVNPVATPHFNFTTPEPTGVVGVVCPDSPPLSALVALVAPVLVAGNSTVVILSETHPLPALTLGEVLQNSDLPGGTINLLSGQREELCPPLAQHMDVNAVVSGVDDPEINKVLQEGSALNMKRFSEHRGGKDWSRPVPEWILDTVEFKTAWHPIGF